MSHLRSRRDVLKMPVVVAGALAPTACYREGVEPGALSEEASARFFPQSLASGDPRPDAIVLWVRVEDPNRARQDLALKLVMSSDAEQTQQLELTAESLRLVSAASADGCLLVRVTGLEPDTTYYYRFSYEAAEGTAYTRIGRTRTAPEPKADITPKFAVISCQDYNGKYFHVHRHVAEQDVDFVLHLGDYVYETVSDPSFQTPTQERRVVFSAPDEALDLGGDGRSSLAAQSLSNYRDLYKQYRSDPDLQALHERHPIIAIWDDHEFSDDSHGDVANYSDGRRAEASPERRAAADQAYFEYMPIDYDTAPAAKLDAKADFPDNFALYRSFVFGRHLELVVTDLRRFRPDHLVPEDAPPGQVFLTQMELDALFGQLPADAVPYVDIESYADGAYLDALREAAEILEITPAKLTGNISAVWINSALASLEDSAAPEPIDLGDETLERGYAYHSLLKTKEFSRIGSRYVVAVGAFEALAKKLEHDSQGKSELVMGATQREWFLDTVRSSTRTFKVWASEIAFLSRHIDLTGVTAAPPELQQLISISAEDWDGFPNERRALLAELADAGNVVILSGDLHCFFAGTPCLKSDPDRRVVELTTSSVSSTTWLDAIEGSLVQDGNLGMDVQTLVQNVGFFLGDTNKRPNPHLAFQQLGRNGYSLIQVGEDELSMTLYTLSPEDVATPPSDLKESLDDLFATERFRTRAGSSDLEREIDGAFLTWSMEEMAFL
jgi:alkaline phosphatase D